MTISIGANPPSSIFFGAQAVSAVHVGATQVWPVGPASWTPADLPNAKIAWIDLTDESRITRAGNSSIASVADKFGGSANAVAGSGAVFTNPNADFGGLSVGDFTNSVLSLQYSGVSNASQFSLIKVMQFGSADTNQTSANTFFFQRVNFSLLVRMPQGVADKNIGAAYTQSSMTIITPFFAVVSSDSANAGARALSLNGTDIPDWNPTATAASFAALGPGVQFMTIGSLGVEPLNGGHVAELILVEGLLSVDDRRRVEGYIAHKYGFLDKLPAAHPYKVDAP